MVGNLFAVDTAIGGDARLAICRSLFAACVQFQTVGESLIISARFSMSMNHPPCVVAVAGRGDHGIVVVWIDDELGATERA